MNAHVMMIISDKFMCYDNNDNRNVYLNVNHLFNAPTEVLIACSEPSDKSQPKLTDKPETGDSKEDRLESVRHFCQQLVYSWGVLSVFCSACGACGTAASALNCSSINVTQIAQ